ncbi:MAG TPA: M28 family peptidase, partial [Steroidobacteraceae bacterium]
MRIGKLLAGILPLVFAATGVVSCVTQPFVRAGASTEVDVDARALESHVRMLAVTLHPRSVDNPPNLDRAADYVLAQFNATGAATEQQLVEADGRQFRNLIARFGPLDGPVVVIGAHYDSCGDTPGADDNASGVAALLEL